MNEDEKMGKIKDRLVVFLTCLSCALLLMIGYQHEQYREARGTISKQETQLKELYGQVNELTLQYVEIVKRLQRHGQ